MFGSVLLSQGTTAEHGLYVTVVYSTHLIPAVMCLFGLNNDLEHTSPFCVPGPQAIYLRPYTFMCVN